MAIKGRLNELEYKFRSEAENFEFLKLKSYLTSDE